MVKICVVGAGIIGLSSAVCIQQKYPNADITIVSEKFSPDTTGDGAAGLWGPYLLGDNSPEIIAKWSGKTHEFFLKLWNTTEGGQMGLTLLPCYRVTDDETAPVPEWKNVVYGFRDMVPAELKALNRPNARQAHAYTTFICECSKLLPVLLRQFQDAGGKVVHKRVDNLHDIGSESEYDIVVNCTGVGARAVANDNSVFPIRGQILRVNAPGIFYAVLDDNEHGGYVIPNQHRVVLGGTHQEHDWNLNPSNEDRKSITDICFGMIPSLKTAPVLQDFVGLRPARPTVRLEMETMSASGSNSKGPAGSGKSFTVIHNYGHGGSGVTLFWGCALDTCELVGKAIGKIQGQHQHAGRSKL